MTSSKNWDCSYIGGLLNNSADMEQHLGNTTSMTFSQHLRDLWKSPRGTVIRIEALALVAIALSFFLVAFGSCRRWSKRWIIQKGILAANALSLSLGTYSIGLMQSSPVKSEMYPVWAVSLLTLFGSIDSITAYSLDYNSQFLKLLYQLCLYCGYVLLIGISTVSSEVGNIAIGVLCAITFIKGFHRSLACVLLSRLRTVNKLIADYMEDYIYSPEASNGYDPVSLRGYAYVVDWPLDKAKNTEHRLLKDEIITIDKIWYCNINSAGSNARSYKDVSLSFSLSHLLQRRFFGFRCAESERRETCNFVIDGLLKDSDGVDGYERAFRVIEAELAFLYDLFFTSNAFLHYYESKAATVWAFASIAGIVFVGIATVIPGTRTTRTSGGTVVVNTTTYDLIITLVILVSLALLQVLQLIRCWTSNWSRVAFVCQFLRNGSGSCWMRLKAFLCRINWFDNYPWQRKLGQYSLVESISTKESVLLKHVKRPFTVCVSLLRMFGAQYIEQAFQEMFGSNSTGNPVVFSTDVKKAIVDSLIRTGGRPRNGSSSLEANDAGRQLLWACTQDARPGEFSQAKDNQTRIILTWHIATCYLEMEQCRNYCLNEKSVEGKELKTHCDVATKLSRYCAYLIVSAPQLLPGQQSFTKSVYNSAVRDARLFLHGAKDKYEAMRGLQETELSEEMLFRFLEKKEEMVFQMGVRLGKQLEEIPDETLRWKVLADFWAEMLLYVAPSDDVKEHIEHLAQGGEFITHLWALMFHAGIVNRGAQHVVQTWV